MDNQYYYDSIPIGFENAVTLKELAAMWNMHPDKARHKIAELRAEDNGDDYIIFASSNPHTAGYYKTDNPMERRAFMIETKSRALNTFKPLKKARRIERSNNAVQYSLDNNLKLIRQNYGMKNSDLVRALNKNGVYIDKALLSRIENGYVLPTPQMAAAMAEIFECDVSELFGLEFFGGVM